MLVLSRKEGEGLILRDERTGEEIRVVVVGIRASRVIIGIDAPKESFAVVREEIAGTQPKTSAGPALSGA